MAFYLRHIVNVNDFFTVCKRFFSIIVKLSKYFCCCCFLFLALVKLLWREACGYWQKRGFYCHFLGYENRAYDNGRGFIATGEAGLIG